MDAVIFITAITIIVFLYKYIQKLLKLKNMQIQDETIDKTLMSLGCSYDFLQDIFYSDVNAWQRDMGYTCLYDEAAPLMSMIIDCEPIYFEYDNKCWLIEFWKGQYGILTGCEIGVYDAPRENIDKSFRSIFYNCVSSKDMLKMSFVLKKSKKKIMSRKGIHWWLSGFKLGEFSNPHELSMFIKITLKDNLMRNAFVKGLKEAGYNDEEIVIVNNTVRLVFHKPKTQQPYSRNIVADFIMQSNNKQRSDEFNYLTSNYHNSLDKIKYISQEAPELLNDLSKLGRNKFLVDFINS